MISPFSSLFNLCVKLWHEIVALVISLGTLYSSVFWLFVGPLSGLLLLVAAVPILIGIAGQYYPTPIMKVSFYAGLAEFESRKFYEQSAGETADSEQPSPDILEVINTTPFGNLLYRRLLKAENGSKQASYMLAAALARENKPLQARQQMQRLAPVAGGGFAPAHAWLAVELLSRRDDLTETEQSELMTHLAEADKWENCRPGMRAAYAELLAGKGDFIKAVEVLEKASRQDPKLRVPLTAMAKLAGLERRAAEVSGEMEDDLEIRVNGENPQLEDIIQLASLMLIIGNSQRSWELVDKGLRLDPNHPQLRRLASRAILMEFRKTLSPVPDGLELNLDLLNAALKADPTNPELTAELARAMNFAINLSPEMTEKLEAYLASGRASALVHLMLSTDNLSKEQLATSIFHLEIANQLAPKSPIILSQLALALALTDPSQLDRSFSLINDAIGLAEEQAGPMETQGKLYLIAGKPLEAIPCFEKVLQVNSDAIETRKLLVEAYQAAEMVSAAKNQLEIIESLEKSGGK